jgi:hypothetical protein
MTHLERFFSRDCFSSHGLPVVPGPSRFVYLSFCMSSTVLIAAAGGMYSPRDAVLAGLETGVRNGLAGGGG